MEQNLVVKTAMYPPQTLYSIRKRIGIPEFPGMFDRLFQELGQKGLHPSGPPMVFYHDEEFDRESSDIEFAVPVAEEGEGLRPLAGGLCCFTTLLGPYESEAFTGAYAGIVRWIEENGYRMAGPPFDRYVRGGGQCPPEENVTEIYFPIVK